MLSLAFASALKGITLPAARTEAVFMKSLREELILIRINMTGKLMD